MHRHLVKPMSIRGQIIYKTLYAVLLSVEKRMTRSVEIMDITTGSSGNVSREIGLSW